ncbi:MAG TPA: hypothetical protein VKQ08_06645 [Cyclobacteriaceae bacterium]|nr:hypothetical protein [Cyclobacteriaceae bacterium]
MEDQEEKIIVFRAYDTVVEANLAKTKLDAYGIPCFLTDENFIGLYPIRNELFPGVRLHIFERDFDQVTETLTEIPMERSCPYCRSKNIDRDVTKENKSLKIIAALTSGILFADRMVFKCLDCHREFEYPDYQ